MKGLKSLKDEKLKKIIIEHREGRANHKAKDCPQFSRIKKYLPKRLWK